MSDTEWFVEKMGLLAENDGMPRIAGRIFGLLILSPEPLSLDALAERLGVSKGSVSTDARLLERCGMIERSSRPGDRRDYYQVRPRLYECTLERRLERMRELHELIGEAALRLDVDCPVVKARLAEFDAAYTHLLRLVQAAFDAWPEARGRRSGGGSRAAGYR